MIKLKCPACDSFDCKPFYFGPIGNRVIMNIYICNYCEHIFANPMPSEKFLNFFYSENIYSNIEDIKGKSWENWNEKNKSLKNYNDVFKNQYLMGTKYIEIFENQIKKKEIKGEYCIDFGCGVGGILKAFSEKLQLKPIGIEANKEKIKIAMKNHITIFSDIFSNYDWINKNAAEVSLIIATDFLEHLPNPKKFIRKIKNTFPKAYVFFGVPGFGHMHIKESRPLVGMVKNLPHLQYFSENSFKNIFINQYKSKLISLKNLKYYIIIGFPFRNEKNTKKPYLKSKKSIFRKYYKRQLYFLFKLAIKTIYIITKDLIRSLKQK